MWYFFPFLQDLVLLMHSQHLAVTTVPDEVIKIGSLLKVFSTVIKSLGQDFDPMSSHDLSMPFFLDVSSFEL